MLYVSLSSVSTDSPQICRIVEISQARNSRSGVTGFLYFDEAIFVQLLEGLEDDVTAIYRSICADHRHSQIRTLLAEEAGSRLFGGWDMGFFQGSKGIVIDGLTGRALHDGADTVDPHSVIRFLRDLIIDFKGVRQVS